jgi:hypothetical protein
VQVGRPACASHRGHRVRANSFPTLNGGGANYLMDAIAKAFIGFRKYFDAHDLDPDLARKTVLSRRWNASRRCPWPSTFGGVAYD